MRKPRDIDAELKALGDRQKVLRSKRVAQLGALVTATGADAFDPETLAGVLLAAIEDTAKSAEAKEAWRRKGENFFRRERRRKANGTEPHNTGSSETGSPDEPGSPAPRHGDAATG